MTVRVANDFKTETQVAYENLIMDNKVQRDKIRTLEQEIVKLNKGTAVLHTNESHTELRLSNNLLTNTHTNARFFNYQHTIRLFIPFV